MPNFIFGVMIVSFIIIFIGMFSPYLALSFLKDKYQTRLYVVLIFGLLTILSFSGYKISIANIERATIIDEENKIKNKIIAYNYGIDRQLGLIKDSWIGMDQLLKEIQKREIDEDWTLMFNATIDTMETTIKEAKLLDPPKEYEESHKLYLKAIDKLSSAPEKMPEVIANKDGHLLRSIGEDRKEAMEYIEEFITMILKIRNQER